MSNLSDVKAGDPIALWRRGVDTSVRKAQVERVTAKQIVLPDGTRWNRDTGCKVPAERRTIWGGREELAPWDEEAEKQAQGQFVRIRARSLAEDIQRMASDGELSYAQVERIQAILAGESEK